jgi:diacylglycerol kinase (ATP)
MEPGEEPFTFPRLTWPQKFAVSFRGCYLGVRCENSFLVHIPAAAVVIGAAAFFRVSPLEWCALILSIGIVLAAELGNTALESLAKAVARGENAHVALALDVASGAVLVAAFAAVAVGLIIFAPRLWALVV